MADILVDLINRSKKDGNHHRKIPEVERAIKKYQNLHIFLECVYKRIISKKYEVENMKKLQKDLSSILQLILSTESIFSSSKETLEEICSRIDRFLEEFKPKKKKNKEKEEKKKGIKKKKKKIVLTGNDVIQEVQRKIQLSSLKKNPKKIMMKSNIDRKNTSNKTRIVNKKSRKMDHFMKCVIKEDSLKKLQRSSTLEPEEEEESSVLEISCQSCFVHPLKNKDDLPVLLIPCCHPFCNACFEYWIKEFQIAQVQKSCPFCDSKIQDIVRDPEEILKRVEPSSIDMVKLSCVYPDAKQGLLTRHHLIDRTHASISRIRRKYDRKVNRVMMKNRKCRKTKNTKKKFLKKKKIGKIRK